MEAIKNLIREWKQEQADIQQQLYEGADNTLHQAELDAKDQTLQSCIRDLERIVERGGGL